MSDVEKGSKQEVSREAQVANLQSERIRIDFAHLDEQALQEANEQPAITDYVEDLQKKLDGATQLLQELRQSIMSGDHLSDEIDKKVKLEQMLDNARNKFSNPILGPVEPSEVTKQQARFENVKPNFDRRFIINAEIMSSALNGEGSSEETYKGEMAKKYNVENIRTNLSADQVAELQTQISSAVDRLKELQPEIEKIAEQKALKGTSVEKNDVLKNYESQFESYTQTSKELRQVLQDVEKARSKN